ncbi:putative leader peptide [Pseudonocardia sp. C8]|uniref:putative leader peptide n=1 Tax=Pseudonocardia sp. C8 TaxID=2762759 RepID=UPI00351C427C
MGPCQAASSRSDRHRCGRPDRRKPAAGAARAVRTGRSRSRAADAGLSRTHGPWSPAGVSAPRGDRSRPVAVDHGRDLTRRRHVDLVRIAGCVCR